MISNFIFIKKEGKIRTSLAFAESGQKLDAQSVHRDNFDARTGI